MGTHLVLCSRLCPDALPSKPTPKMKLCFAHVNTLLWVWRPSSKKKTQIRGCYPAAGWDMSPAMLACLASCTTSVAWLPHRCALPPSSLPPSLCTWCLTVLTPLMPRLLWTTPCWLFPSRLGCSLLCPPAWTLGNGPDLEVPKHVTRINPGGNNSCNIK